MNKPLIGISCSYNPKESNGFHSYVQQLNDSYITAVKESGGIPIIIPNCLKEADYEEICDHFDGFLFSGGGDVDPVIYGKQNNGLAGGISAERDECELALLRYLLNETDKPIFAVCRGVQILNVAMGGTLIIDLMSEGKNNHSFIDHPRDVFTHEIEVSDHTKLKSILQDENHVNSFHHQALDEVGDGLIVTAYSSDDHVIEAVEVPGERFILGVQWHPEELIAHPGHKRLFESFVSSCCHKR